MHVLPLTIPIKHLKLTYCDSIKYSLNTNSFDIERYAPNVDIVTLEKLTSAFTDLRVLTDEGTLAYPYPSARLDLL